MSTIDSLIAKSRVQAGAADAEWFRDNLQNDLILLRVNPLKIISGIAVMCTAACFQQPSAAYIKRGVFVPCSSNFPIHRYDIHQDGHFS